MDNTLEKVKSILGKDLGFSITKIKENSKLVEDLGADSLDKVEIIMDIENEFDLTIPDKDAEKFETVKDILDFLSKNN
jgi:acyl carrier protein